MGGILTNRMERKFTALTQQIGAMCVVASVATVGLVFVVLNEPPQAHRNVLSTIVPLAILIFLAGCFGGTVVWYVQRHQAFVRVAGMRRDRAADLLLPIYTTMVHMRYWLLAVTCLVGLGSFMVTGLQSLVLIPSACVAMMIISFPTRRRFEKFIESGIAHSA